MGKGNRTGRRRLTYDRLTMPQGRPEVPAWLDREAVVYFESICDRVAQTGILATTDGDTVGVMALASLRLSKPIKSLRDERSLCADVLKCAAELGLTPKSRRLLPDPKPVDDKDALKEFLKVG